MKTDIKNITLANTSSVSLKWKLAIQKSEVNEQDIDKLKSLPNNLSSLKNKVDQLKIDKSVPVTVDLSKLTNAVKIRLLKKLNIMLR